jgi:methionine biosynthesis protein MetW
VSAGGRRDYGWAGRDAAPQARPEHDTIVAWVPRGSRVLDLGCGDGTLAARLAAERGCVVRGLEIDPAGVERARARGVDAQVADVDEGLAELADRYDLAVMNVTLHMVYRPGFVLAEMLRVAPAALVSFPNLGWWPNRLDALAGRFPRPALYGYSWHASRHIHLFSWRDFNDLARSLGARVTAARHLGRDGRTPARLAAVSPNLFARVSIARVERGGAPAAGAA